MSGRAEHMIKDGVNEEEVIWWCTEKKVTHHKSDNAAAPIRAANARRTT